MSHTGVDHTTDTDFPELPDDLRVELKNRPVGHVPMRFHAGRWQALIDTLPGVNLELSALDGTIRRDELVHLAHEAIGQDRAIDAFVLTMIWGYGVTGYGPARTRKVLEGNPTSNSKRDASVRSRLAETAELARQGGLLERAEAAYRFINRGEGECKNLGPSFFTKWLYVSSAQGDARNARALPILDEVTRGYVNQQFNSDGQVRVRYTSDYKRYVRLLSRWASDAGNGASAVDVEEAIFAVARRSSASWTDTRELEAVLR